MNSLIPDGHSELFVRGFASDHEDAITLIGYDERKADYIETPYSGGNPDNIRYYTRKIECCAFYATGFTFKHPHGAIITAEFAEPVRALERTLEEDGEEIDSFSFDERLVRAIVAKLGNISGLAAVNLI
ncbi:hypothetical protein ONR75_18570 [Rhodopseudomonas sp. P2A-2r]|uniref:hypothetical protein n=1 Tax=Rhodopseudomonas sp. P2A-2r TaxID=2991972 RepID=UPI002234E92E|nr:hypothetical protein [Rhodopseudomonas sp. P2A-2r]UZE47009.1 hypothetical protein ONR75_18570 [Rhodopseudomonas sp. P2A-2r]